MIQFILILFVSFFIKFFITHVSPGLDVTPVMSKLNRRRLLYFMLHKSGDSTSQATPWKDNPMLQTLAANGV